MRSCLAVFTTMVVRGSFQKDRAIFLVQKQTLKRTRFRGGQSVSTASALSLPRPASLMAVDLQSSPQMFISPPFWAVWEKQQVREAFASQCRGSTTASGGNRSSHSALWLDVAIVGKPPEHHSEASPRGNACRTSFVFPLLGWPFRRHIHLWQTAWVEIRRYAFPHSALPVK